ncbi:MAG: hypothetical protein QG553_77 [Patescibacteria group bacterium]|nr:hypothetical protein [Patescibacteria group bacterium]
MGTPKRPEQARSGMLRDPSDQRTVRTAVAAALFANNLSLSNLFHPDVDMTFTGQMEQVTTTPEAIHPDLQTPPDLYLFTAYSAVPIADAVRGYYQAAGWSVPALGYIQADSRLSDWFRDGSAKSISDAESERLAELTNGKEHVCVLDQHVASGMTLVYAGHLLQNAGVEAASAIRGYGWYQDAHSWGVDLKGVTSHWQDLMTEIGHAAYQQTSQGAINA